MIEFLRDTKFTPDGVWLIVKTMSRNPPLFNLRIVPVELVPRPQDRDEVFQRLEAEVIDYINERGNA